MENKSNKASIWASPHLWIIAVIMMACSIFYYLMPIADLIGWTFSEVLHGLHNFDGLDFYALVFLAPVVYAILFIGAKGAALTAMICILLLLPYAYL